MRAASDVEKIRLLLDWGAEVNTRSEHGYTALMLAARPWNSHQAVKLLLDHGAAADAIGPAGATPLMAAAAGGDEKSVQLLLQHGAEVNAEPTFDRNGVEWGGARTALMWAAFRGDVDMLEAIDRRRR